MLLYGFIQVSSALNPTVPTSSEVFNTSCKLRSEVQSHCLHFHCCNCLYPHYVPLSQSHDNVWEQKKLAPMSTRQKMHEMIESSVCHFILFWWSLKSKNDTSNTDKTIFAFGWCMQNILYFQFFPIYITFKTCFWIFIYVSTLWKQQKHSKNELRFISVLFFFRFT